jgi:hypothetical protein
MRIPTSHLSSSCDSIDTATMRSHAHLSIASALALVAFAATACAAPIVYTFSGVATGTIGSTPFSNAPFTITVRTDTDNVTQAAMPPTVLCNTVPFATVSIEGVGAATTTETLFIFVTPDIHWLGLGRATCSPLAQAFLILENAAFSTYDLRGPIGPVANDGSSSGTLGFVSTTLGPLTLSGPPFSFQAVLLSPMPIPAASGLHLLVLSLLIIAFSAGLCRCRRSRPNLSLNPDAPRRPASRPSFVAPVSLLR